MAAKTKDEAAPEPVGEELPGVQKADRMLQLAMIGALAAPWFMLAYAQGRQPDELVREAVDALRLDLAATSTAFLQDNDFWTLMLTLSTPHVLYVIIWTNPDAFYGAASRFGEPFQVMATIAHIIKAVQAYAAASYLFGQDTITDPETLRHGFGWCRDYLHSLPRSQLLLGTELILLGQVFNSFVYKTIGEAGVYYGCRLRQQVPWFFGFPFSVVPHPQYLGATISVWGAAVLLATPDFIAKGTYGIMALVTCFYAFSSFTESYL